MKPVSNEIKQLLSVLPYYNCKVVSDAHPQFNNSLESNLTTKNLLKNLPGLFDLGLVHTMPDKFENATLSAKTDKMFCVHTTAFFR